ncbi:hypothetical protein [Pseudoxanthomonas wuyuanensis]|uniref:Uncharacterized protein n=1 Tax=Pseudoxanthomonas wuyuanensis TaxID=1073196 RepID=A0A286D4M9_9GAMM|nr:hypothetical protein [Pseudoxanthomonas wuyuanensis]KAF1719778.1 hypothetical protein CSC75_13895 [Pseudoxanthomonas wuyuanensis]SOD53605.1 hypothetical protein SAMN06296416_102495 [Pseudoxanthomonas wuyuanensis]
MTEKILTFAALQRMCRPTGPAPRASTVVRWAERQHIRYKYDGQGGIWTTMEALNAALGVSARPVSANDEPRIEDMIA